jgi:hypothetical protein
MKIEIQTMRVVRDGFTPRVEGETVEARVNVSVDGLAGELRLRLGEDGAGFAPWGAVADWLGGELLAHLQGLTDMPRVRREAVLTAVAVAAGQLATDAEAEITELGPEFERFTISCPFVGAAAAQ